MFVEKLWKENPKLTKEVIENIFNIDTVTGDGIKVYGIKEGAITVGMYKSLYSIISDEGVIGRLNDFEVLDNCFGISKKIYTERWMRFMYKVFGDEYAMQYISQRNQQLDKFMAEYEEKFNAETRKTLKEMNFGSIKANQYITKRNQELDKFMAEYEEKFNRETKKTLVEMGFKKEQNRTK
jgi:hypothetical protein